jgi:hypothetical protein
LKYFQYRLWKHLQNEIVFPEKKQLIFFIIIRLKKMMMRHLKRLRLAGRKQTKAVFCEKIKG